METIAIIGAGLAGCECALTLARQGMAVTIFEQKPVHKSPAHTSNLFAELVCSNSFRSEDECSAIGILKKEMRLLGSSLMAVAEECRVPADKALAVDREAFAQAMTAQIMQQPLITGANAQIAALDDPLLAAFQTLILAAGPMPSPSLSEDLARTAGTEHCYFYDAIAPIVWSHSLNMDIIFRASRYGMNENGSSGDYLNCPMNREEYMTFYEALCQGKTMPARNFEKELHFEGCMPIEALAGRGSRTLSFGPLKPVGLIDPRTGRRPWACLQLRAEKTNGDAYNLVGCQTKLLQAEQKRIFALVPGLEHAEFMRYGSMHRNTFINAPAVLNADLSLKCRPHVFLAGQISGVEGYVESAASGLWLGHFLACRARGKYLAAPPATTALGSLLLHLQTPAKSFQPSNAVFGLMPALDQPVSKKERKMLYSKRAQTDFSDWLLHNAL